MKNTVNKMEAFKSVKTLDDKLALIGRCLGAVQLALLPFKFLGFDVYAPGYMQPQTELSKFVFVKGNKIHVCTVEVAIAHAQRLKCSCELS